LWCHRGDGDTARERERRDATTTAFDVISLKYCMGGEITPGGVSVRPLQHSATNIKEIFSINEKKKRKKLQPSSPTLSFALC